MRVAVIDLGTNSTRLFVADVEDGRLIEHERHSIVTRLGQGVDESGELSGEAIARVLDVLDNYWQRIERLSPAKTVALATSAVREAGNADDLRDELKKRYGLGLDVVSGEQEALYTYLGATYDRPAAAGEEMVLVIDIGGGSTEFIAGRGRKVEFSATTELGCVRQSERHLLSDPPADDGLTRLSEEARSAIEGAVPASIRREVREAVAVAGTATSLAAVAQRLDPYDPEKVHRYCLELDAITRIFKELAVADLEERVKVTGLHPDRAPTIVAGTAILIEALAAFGLQSVEVSEKDLLHGAALSIALHLDKRSI